MATWAYRQDGYTVPCLKVRPLRIESVNPMCWPLFRTQRWDQTMVRVLIQGIGGRRWINVKRSDLIEL